MQSRQQRSAQKRPRPSPRPRPPIPPPPPASLVSLIQSDSNVLHYFQCLQQNLEADVQIWKDRAALWQARCEEIKSTLSTHSNSANVGRKKKKTKTISVSKKIDPALNASPRRRVASRKDRFTNPEDNLVDEQSVDDQELIDLMEQSTSSGSVSSDDDENAKLRELLLKTVPSSSSSSSSSSLSDPSMNGKETVLQSSDDNSHKDDMVRLAEAVDFFRDEFGISLLALPAPLEEALPDFPSGNKQVVRSRATGMGDSKDSVLERQTHAVASTPTHELQPTPPTYPSRLSSGSILNCASSRPAHVIFEIMSCIRMLCRIQLFLADHDVDLAKSYYPFDMITLLPVIDSVWYCEETNAVHDDHHHFLPAVVNDKDPATTGALQHPAIRVYHLLLRAVLILTTFTIECDNRWGSSRDEMIHSSLHARVAETQQDKEEQLGSLLRMWLTSLQAEIAEVWACQDRSQHFTSPALCFDSSTTRNDATVMAETKVRVEDCVTDCSVDGLLETNENCVRGFSKVQNRLSTLLERYWMAQLVVKVLLLRGEEDLAFQIVLDHIYSSTSTLHDNLSFAPTFSLVTVRGLLHPGNSRSGGRSWLINYIDSLVENEISRCTLKKCLALSLNYVASLWHRRLKSSDDRIVVMSKVELASFRELIKLESSWLASSLHESPLHARDLDAFIQNLTAEEEPTSNESINRVQSAALELALIMRSDFRSVREALQKYLLVEQHYDRHRWFSITATRALRQLVLRQLDLLMEQVGRVVQSQLGEHQQLQECISLLLELNIRNDPPLRSLGTILYCAALLGDGKAALVVMEQLLKEDVLIEVLRQDMDWQRQLLESIRKICDTPTIRVINLKRRTDRWDVVRAQALREGLLVFRAVHDLSSDTTELSSDNLKFYGDYAFDGGGRRLEVYERFSRQLSGSSKLHSFVNQNWCPNDLKPFDKEAPIDEELVKMTDSETACALSHVASWQGAFRAFQLESGLEISNSCTSLFRHPAHVHRLVRLGGFASGEALLYSHSSMNPAPVCIIVEDDVVFVDRFRERLSELLSELPRDFHICSLGYSRPKSAPILPWSNTVGIPSHLFYMTGYLVSEEGCRYLLNSLPVVGPVDAWIGLKMTRNWDNSFGVARGVGSHSRPLTKQFDCPPRKDLSRILQFRAYCALTPLCSQRVMNTEREGVICERRSWRHRDTDIVYSGDSRHRRSRP